MSSKIKHFSLRLKLSAALKEKHDPKRPRIEKRSRRVSRKSARMEKESQSEPQEEEGPIQKVKVEPGTVFL